MKSSLLVVLLFGIPLLTRLFFYYDALPVYEDGDRFQKTYSLMHEPKKNSFSQYFFVDGIFVSMPLYPKFYYGETLNIQGVVKMAETEKGELLKLSDVKIVKKETSNPLIFLTGVVRERVARGIVTALPEREAGLLLGIILGVRDRIDTSFYEQLRTVGVLHVVAASGQNVSILAAFVLILLQKFVKRYHAVFFTAAIILFYSVLSGFDPPIVRASIMSIISFGAIVAGRQSGGMMALIFTCYIMVLFAPGLLTDVSFQLSFLATFGILTIKPLIDKIMLLKRVRFLQEDIATTFSAQIATLPILLGVFGSYSFLSLPVNILVLWTVPILMIIGGIAALAAIISPVFALPFAMLAYPFLYFFTSIVEFFADFSLLMEVDTLPQTLIFGYYLIVFAIVMGANNRERRKI